ncbi:polysaccharide deacetylase family protein [Lyngbya confervoides]|uniref:Polysaccharide deacetylase family protein n=1 Tax=Lyngbya confervoides BDU141951 TaxID=1574623 RepID=A0ABD4T7K1_9CYAN|nr:polysaccharide deacetylase family protein [Lyngbya confervoides]MCM1984693.1 polysaccharide deacetylase family protein [Lyngbya confervoides BDU141951]
MPQLASISLDLDNQWSYMRAQGIPGWDQFPSYLPQLVPKILQVLEQLDLRLTVFVVGRDAEVAENIPCLRAFVAAGHSLGNHSYLHQPWMHEASVEAIRAELEQAEQAIQQATGQILTGFRGPGFAVSRELLALLQDRGYRYDASVFPTYLGSIVRRASLRGVPLAHRPRRKPQFGTFADGFRPLRPYRWQVNRQTLLEIPVTTLPILRIPIHFTYLHFLAQRSRSLATVYFHLALGLCQLFRMEPSFLLHPLDFVGGDQVPELRSFPGMGMRSDRKCALTVQYLKTLQRRYRLMALSDYVEVVAQRDRWRTVVL